MELYKTEDFYRQKATGRGSYISEKQINCAKVPFPLGMAGIYQADDLIGADQLISDRLV